MEIHAFYIDQELGSDWAGRYYCVTCGMPKRHPNHDLPERPPEDVSERIIGEGNEIERGPGGADSVGEAGVLGG